MSFRIDDLSSSNKQLEKAKKERETSSFIVTFIHNYAAVRAVPIVTHSDRIGTQPHRLSVHTEHESHFDRPHALDDDEGVTQSVLTYTLSGDSTVSLFLSSFDIVSREK